MRRLAEAHGEVGVCGGRVGREAAHGQGVCRWRGEQEDGDGGERDAAPASAQREGDAPDGIGWASESTVIGRPQRRGAHSTGSRQRSREQAVSLLAEDAELIDRPRQRIGRASGARSRSRRTGTATPDTARRGASARRTISGKPQPPRRRASHRPPPAGPSPRCPLRRRPMPRLPRLVTRRGAWRPDAEVPHPMMLVSDARPAAQATRSSTRPLQRAAQACEGPTQPFLEGACAGPGGSVAAGVRVAGKLCSRAPARGAEDAREHLPGPRKYPGGGDAPAHDRPCHEAPRPEGRGCGLRSGPRPRDARAGRPTNEERQRLGFQYAPASALSGEPAHHAAAAGYSATGSAPRARGGAR
jgi:hypothetical protein